MRVLLFGSEGQVGTDLTHALEGHEVVAPREQECLIEDRDAVAKYARAQRFDWVVNSAALTKVDECEAKPHVAFAVNALGPRNIALECRESATPLLYISTDYVFNGAKGTAYEESDTPDPLSVYGVSKFAGELFTRHIAPVWTIVRTSTVFGPGYGKSPGANFVEAILRGAEREEPLRVVDDQTASPTFSKDLAERIVELMLSRVTGIVHVTNKGECSFFEFARTILALTGCKKEVIRITTADLNRPAARPAYSVLKHSRLAELGFSPMRDWQDALREYLQQRHGLADG